MRYLPSQSVQTHHGPVVGAQRPNRVGQDVLQGQQDLVVQPADQVTVSPAGGDTEQTQEGRTERVKINNTTFIHSWL